jgi:predicted Zn-dependent protease
VDVLAPPQQRCEDPALAAALRTIVGRLTAGSPPSPYTIRVYVVNRPVVNAVAAPGGYVVIFRGLLERTRTPEELAGVMAHELQHVRRRHTTRAVIQNVGTGLLLMALTGDMTGPMVYGLETARALGELRYSRHAEEEADREGMKMLLAAHMDPAGMLAFFEAIRKEEGAQPEALKYLSSHPMPAERIARLRALAAAAGPAEPVLPGEDWPTLARRC